MSSIQIPCPKCGAELRLRDRGLLGRRGKCPSCAHRFILEEPEEIELELADPSLPPVGTAPQWVPDEPEFPEPAGRVRSQQQRGGTPAPIQFAEWPTPPAPSGSLPKAMPPLADEFPDAPSDHSNSAASIAPEAELPGFDIPAAPGDGVSRLKELRRRNAKRRNIGILVGSLIGLALIGSYFAVQAFQPEGTVDQKPAEAPAPVAAIPQLTELEQKEANVEFAKAASPTRGEPISLQFIPAGARIIVNLRPAELWRSGSLGEEFRYCLGPLAEWTEAKITELCLYEPAQIEEALVCLILGPKGSPPETAVVVRLVEEQKKSVFIQKFQGEPTDQFGYPVYMGEKRAFLIHDLKTFAAAPKHLAADMVDARVHGGPTADGIQQLLPETDRKRHITVVFEPADLRLHQEVLVPPLVLPLLNETLDWLNEDDVETVAWSLHVSDPFYSEMLLRNRQVIRPSQLERDLRKRLDALPLELLTAVRKMNPEKSGHRKIIGRFPAMMQAFAATTLTGIGDRHVQLATLLPERAAPNLALGSLLAWDESTRTDFTKAAPAETPSTGTKSPERIADRLKKPIDIDFRRTPLQEAFAYIAEETRVAIDIEGDALKFAGYTKNMPQTFNLGTVPATQAISAILKQYDQMVIVVDEQAQIVTVMTKAFAQQKGLQPFPLEP